MIKCFFSTLLLMSIACSYTATPTPTSTQVVPSPVPTKETVRCVQATNKQAGYIRTGVKGGGQFNDITGNVWAVKSNDFENLWFIAAQMTGPGLQPEEAIGVWAILGHIESPYLILSIDGFAKSFSSYPDGATSNPQISMSNDGAQVAKDCVLTFN